MWKKSLSRVVLMGVLAGAVLPLQGCPKKVEIEDIKPFKAEMQVTVNQFLAGFYGKNPSQVLAYSATPFYLDQRAILAYDEEWANALREVFKANTAVKHQIQLLQLLNAKELPLFNAQIWEVLVPAGFHNRAYAYIELLLGDKKPVQEKVILILDLRETGWKVVGFLR